MCDDFGCQALSQMLEKNSTLKVLNLAHNNICQVGGEIIGPAIQVAPALARSLCEAVVSRASVRQVNESLESLVLDKKSNNKRHSLTSARVCPFSRALTSSIGILTSRTAVNLPLLEVQLQS